MDNTTKYVVSALRALEGILPWDLCHCVIGYMDLNTLPARKFQLLTRHMSPDISCIILEYARGIVGICQPPLKFKGGPINTLTVAFGKVVVGLSAGTLSVWDFDGIHVRDLVGHIGSITAFTTLGPYLVSASADRSILFWDLEAGTRVRSIRTKGAVVAMENWGGLLAECSFGCAISARDPVTGHILRTLNGHTNGVKALAVWPDGRLASGSWDHTARVWDPSGECLYVLGHMAPVNCLAAMPNGTLASGSSDAKICLWDIYGANAGACVRVLIGNENQVNCVATLDGLLISGSHDRNAQVYSDDGSTMKVLPHSRAVKCVEATSSGIVVTLDYNNTVSFWR
jgi:WD40 repeat protein